jgi:AraC-like DNA-binding protein
MLLRVGLPSRCLEQAETQINAWAAQRLLETSAQLSGAEDFGLQLASKRQFSNLGPISLVLREEPTGLQALQTLCRYLRLVNASLFTHLEQRGEHVLIREDIMHKRSASPRQAIELALGVMTRTLSELMGSTWRPHSVHFAHSPPQNMRTHHALFGPNVQFNAEFNGIVCNARDLHRQLPRTDPGLANHARHYLEQALGQHESDRVQAVRQLVGTLLPGGRCTADQVALHLGVDRRTVHRWLSHEGECFSSVLRGVRREFVQRQIAHPDRPLTEVAELLGFSGPSAFAHWFRAEFTCTVSAWRRAHVQAKDHEVVHRDGPMSPQPGDES